MANKSKPKTPKLKPYVYRGLFRCRECGCFITTETQKGHNYLHCTKRKGPCAQPYVREEVITKQVRASVQKVSLCSAWAYRMIAELQREKTETAQAEGSFAQKLRDQIVFCQEKLDKLLDMRLEGSLTQEEYAAKKRRLVEEKIDLSEKLAAFERKSHNRFEPMSRFIEAANQAGFSALQENPEETRDFLKKIGSNFRIAARALSFDFVMPWKILTKYQDAQAAALLNSAETEKCETWRRGRDSGLAVLCKTKPIRSIHPYLPVLSVL